MSVELGVRGHLTFCGFGSRWWGARSPCHTAPRDPTKAHALSVVSDRVTRSL